MILKTTYIYMRNFQIFPHASVVNFTTVDQNVKEKCVLRFYEECKAGEREIWLMKKDQKKGENRVGEGLGRDRSVGPHANDAG